MKVGFFGGDVTKLTDDCSVLKPTVFPSVPRLYNRIYGKIQDKFKAATGCKGILVNSATGSKLASLKETGGFSHCFFDALVFKKVRAMLGGCVKLMVTGSAPIHSDVLDFLKVCFCCDICEGYGMTETSGGSFVTFPGDPNTGVVGGPVQNVKIRLKDIPEMGYTSNDKPNPRGEICFWGPSVMSGYFKNPEKTAEAFHDGWLLSGDVGMVYPNGAVKIIDRAKNIFKLSQGEYIAPEKLEGVYVQSEWVLQSWIYGDSLKDFIVAVVVVDPERLAIYAKSVGKEVNDNLLEECRAAIMTDFNTLAAKNKFNSLEKPKWLILRREPFSIENEILTPTMKIKRNIAKKVF